MRFYAVLAVLAAAVCAQNQTVGNGIPNFNSAAACCTLDANSVGRDERISWCRAQQNSCQSLCTGATAKNDCDSTALSFDCQCFKGQTPNISDYSQTLPSLQCEAWVGKCVEAHPNDLAGQNLCHSIACGSKNATTSGGGSGGGSGGSKTSGGGGGGSGSASPTAGGSGSSSSSSAGGAAQSSGAAVALQVAGQYGTGALAAGILALFGLAL